MPRGALLALLGPSGCGKTTTLRVVAGLDRPDQGRILVDGRDVTALPPYRRRMGVVFQSYALFPHLSVLSNVAFGLRMRGGLSRAGQTRRAAAALEMVGLSAEAAATLGARPMRAFWTVTVPLTLPAVLGAWLLAFVLCVSAFVTPKLMGGGRVFVLATEIYDAATQTLDWPAASVLSVYTLGLLLLFLAAQGAVHRRVAP